MTMITPSYLGETIEYSSLHACRSTLEDPTQGLMAKADTGVAGPVVAELAYRNEYISVRAQIRNADQVWVRDKCRPSTPVAGAPATPVPVAPANAKGPPSKSGSAVY